MTPEIKVLPDVPSLLTESANRIIELASQAIELKGSFSIALSGGRTPEGLYRLLAADDSRTLIDWSRVEVFFSDERCVPPDSDQSNYRLASALLSKVPIPANQIHRMRGEIDPQEAAKAYDTLLQEKFGDGGLDLTLLGMGDDGHTASLFPDTAALQESSRRCAANYVEKLKAWRLTLTAPFINRSAMVMVLLAGADKAKRLQEVLEGPRDPQRLPIQMIQPTDGKISWMIDAAAAGMHEAD